MILDIALGIIVAFVVLAMGRGAVIATLVGAAFYFGFGWIVVLGGLLWALMVVLTFAFNRNERRAIMLSHPRLFARWLRPSERPTADRQPIPGRSR